MYICRTKSLPVLAISRRHFFDQLFGGVWLVIFHFSIALSCCFAVSIIPFMRYLFHCTRENIDSPSSVCERHNSGAVCPPRGPPKDTHIGKKRKLMTRFSHRYHKNRK